MVASGVTVKSHGLFVSLFVCKSHGLDHIRVFFSETAKKGRRQM